MMNIMLLIMGFLFLIKGADYFVNGARDCAVSYAVEINQVNTFKVYMCTWHVINVRFNK